MTVLVLLLSLCLASCSPGVGDCVLEKVEASLSVSDARPLSVQSPREVVSYAYMATPLFEGDEEPFGRCSWTAVEVDGSGKASLGWFLQGLWCIEVRGFNEDGAAVAYAKVDAYLRKGARNVVAANLQYMEDGLKGPSGLSLSFTTPALEDEAAQFEPHVWFTKVDWNDGFSSSPKQELSIEWGSHVEDGAMVFEGAGGDMGQCAGILEVALMGPDGTCVTGQSMLCAFVSGSVTRVEGRLEGGAYIRCSFALTEDRSEIAGFIEVPAGSVRAEGSFDAPNGEAVPVRFVPTSGSAVSAQWCVDGRSVAAGLEVDLTFVMEGCHEVSVLVFDSDGQKTATASVLAFVED